MKEALCSRDEICSPHVAGGNALENSGRYYLARQSTLHPAAINASLSAGAKADMQVARRYQKALQDVVVRNFPSVEQNNYKMIGSAYDKCAYTGRVGNVLLSEAVLVKVGAPTERAVEPLYGGLQDGVHFINANVRQELSDTIRPYQENPAELERMVLNANAYAAWALSPAGMKCYFLELLVGAASKLGYRPRKEGFFSTILDNYSHPVKTTQARCIEGKASAVMRRTPFGYGVHEYSRITSQNLKNLSQMVALCSHFKRLRPDPF